jgi:hypothetical protein
MSCQSYVQRFISILPPGQAFATRECLNLGTRACVDKALQKLVKTRYLLRLTPGVFVRTFGLVKLPTVLEIAKIKAKAFGKELRIHGTDTAAEHNLAAQANQEPTFYVDGSTSSFRYQGQRIHLKKCSRKSMRMEDSKAGLAIRALWSLGKDVVNDWHINKVLHLWQSSREEKQKIMLSKAWMPAWLGDFFPPTTYLGPNPNWATVQPSSPIVRDAHGAIYIPFPHIGGGGDIRPS